MQEPESRAHQPGVVPEIRVEAAVLLRAGAKVREGRRRKVRAGAYSRSKYPFDSSHIRTVLGSKSRTIINSEQVGCILDDKPVIIMH